MTDQAKGSASRIVIDTETAFNTPKSSNKRGKIIPFISCGLKKTQDLSDSAELRNNRNAGKPFPGLVDVSGPLVVPVYSDAFGHLLKAAIGAPTTVETPQAATAGSDVKSGSPTVTIAGGSGGYTFSGAQATAAVGDRVIYEKSGTRYIGYITTVTNTTTGVMQDKRTGGSACADLATATVIAIMQNKAAATPGTITLSSGACTFSAAQANLAVGQMLIYIDTTVKYAWVTAVTDTTHATVVAADGVAPADCTTKNLEWLGIASKWTHTFKVSATAALASLAIEKGFTDMGTAHYELYSGCKMNTLELTATPGGELQATFNVIGANMTSGSTAYDSAALAVNGFKFMQAHNSAKEAGVAVADLREFKFSLNNGLDGDTQCIGSGGIRTALPEGIAQVSGSLAALFKDTTLLAKADGETETSLEIEFNPSASADNLKITIDEAVIARNSPAIEGPKGILLNLDWKGFYENSTNASIATIELINSTGSYA